MGHNKCLSMAAHDHSKSNLDGRIEPQHCLFNSKSHLEDRPSHSWLEEKQVKMMAKIRGLEVSSPSACA